MACAIAAIHSPARLVRAPAAPRNSGIEINITNSPTNPVINTVEVKTIPDIEKAVARLLVEYEDVD